MELDRAFLSADQRNDGNRASHQQNANHSENKSAVVTGLGQVKATGNMIEYFYFLTQTSHPLISQKSLEFPR